MRLRRSAVKLCFLFTLAVVPAQAQMDMEAMMRWGSAEIVRYHIVGDYQGQPPSPETGPGALM